MAAEKQVLKYDCATVNNLLDTVNENKSLFPFDTALNASSQKGLPNSVITKEINALKDATSNNKGYFLSLEKLKAAYPTANEGSKAYVGENYPYKIYLYQSGLWTDSGQTGGDDSFNAGEFYTKTQINQQHEAINNEISRVKKGANYEVLEYETSIATTRLKVPEDNRKGGYMITYNPGTGWIKEQFIGDLTDNQEWIKDENWDVVLEDSGIQAIAENAKQKADLAAENAIIAREQAEYANTMANEAKTASEGVTSAVINTMPIGTIMMSGKGNIFGEDWIECGGIIPSTFEESTITNNISVTVAKIIENRVQVPNFYIVILNDRIFKSTDLKLWEQAGGITFTDSEKPYAFFSCVKIRESNYVALGLGFYDVEPIAYFTSKNGLDWVQEAYPFGTDIAVLMAKANMYVGVITDNNNFYYRGFTNNNWAIERMPFTIPATEIDLCAFFDVDPKSVVAGKKFVLIYKNHIATRIAYRGGSWAKGTDYTSLSETDKITYVCAVYNKVLEETLVIIKYEDKSHMFHTKAFVSKDLEKWEDISSYLPEGVVSYPTPEIEECNGCYLIDSGNVFYSINGKTWIEGSAINVSTEMLYVNENDDKIIALGRVGNIVSADAPIVSPEIPYGYIKIK